MQKRRNVLTRTAALLTRGVVKLVDTGTRAVTSSTQGLQDLYREAKNEYDSDRASVRTVGSPIVMPGASPGNDSPIFYTSSEPPVSRSGKGSTSPTAQAPANVSGGSSNLETGSRKRGRPRKSALLETTSSQGDQSSVILGSDGKPARKKRAASSQDAESSTPKPRGRPRRSTEAVAGGEGGSSTISAPAPRGRKSGTSGAAVSAPPTSDIIATPYSPMGQDLLAAEAPPRSISELDGTTEALIIPDDLTPAGGVSPEGPGAGTEAHHAFGTSGEASVE